MSVAIRENVIDSRPLLIADNSGARPVMRPEFVLPVMGRSAALLHLLLQDTAIDLALASSVVALDAGLAFGVLQLANPLGGDGGGEPIWQLASALVAAGREPLQELLECAPQLDPECGGNTRNLLPRLMRDAVVRACVAQLLARQLGRCNTKKAYLGGLLFDIPRILAKTRKVHDGYRARLLPIMCNSLPAALVRAAISEVDEEGEVSDPLLATILLAELQVRAQADLDEFELWNCWPEFQGEQRRCLLERCRELARWARENMIRMDPWEFMARLERKNSG